MISNSKKLFSILLAAFISIGALQKLEADEKVTLHLKWTHQFQFAGYYIAKEKGFYKDVGLNVDIVERKNGLEGLHKLISEKEGLYGIGTNEVLLQWNSGIPIVVVAVIFQHSPTALFVRRTNSTQSIHDIVGKKVMLSPNVYEILAYLKKEGINENNFISIEHSFNFEDLISGKVDALDGYSTSQTFELNKSKLFYTTFSPRMAGIDFYGDNLFTSKSEVQKHPERVKKFREASLKGWQYAMNHPEETVELILNKYSDKISKEQLLFEYEQMVPLIQPVLVEVGYMNPDRWHHIRDVYAEFGMLPKNLNLKGFLYDPNPKPDYTLIYQSLGIFFVFLIIAWIVQKQRISDRYAKKLETEVNERTEDLKKTNQDLNKINLSLEKTLKELTEAQDRLLSSEKLATIGRLASGMAHELNTPLGAIVSSSRSISEYMKTEFSNVFLFISLFSKNDFELLQSASIECIKERKFLDRKSKLSIKNDLFERYIHKQDMAKNFTEDDVEMIIDSGIYNLPDLLPKILSSQNGINILKCAILISNISQSNIIISIASEKAVQVVKALKSYLSPNKENQIEKTMISIEEEIDTLLSIYHYNIKNNISINKVYKTQKKCFGNRDQLNQVWVNLLNNGIHALKNEGTLEIIVEEKEKLIQVSFIDSGVGIPKEIQNRIFEPFFTTKPVGEGMGLGLDICNKIIQEMKGKIEFESVPGKTIFKVSLPIADE